MSTEPVTGVFNDGYIAEQYELYRKDRNAVDSSWRQFFQFAEGISGGSPASTQSGGGADPALLRKIAAAASLVEAIRAYVHLATPIDPLGAPRTGSTELSAEFHGIAEADLGAIPGDVLGLPDSTAAEAIARLRLLYSSNVGIESEHLGTATERVWLRDYVESGLLQQPLPAEKRLSVLRRLTQVDGLERFLQRVYQGYKRFSIEGTDALVPVLDQIIEDSANAGANEVAIAMAHRGRINVLAHILDKPYATIFDEFEGKHTSTGAESESGDVKYHLGARSQRETGGKKIGVSLMPNPSHLEFVNPVLEGFARARQRTRDASQDAAAVVPVLVHGDAAFPGEGIVAETFNLSRLRGFRTGGTIHIIVNNQVGFTTDPIDARSTRYSSDLAKGFEVPIVHVNADDADSCIRVAEMSVAYRSKFGKDFLIDLVGYRRMGHNETDAPEFTQPELYAKIRKHPRPPQVYAARLVAEATTTAEAAAAIEQEIMSGFERERDETRNREKEKDSTDTLPAPTGKVEAELPAARNEQLVAWNERLLAWPPDLKPNARIATIMSRRRDAMGEKGGIDWGHAEALAFASLLHHGVSIRLTGQDVERGTFSHRQAVLHDSENGSTYTALQHLPEAHGQFEIFNSPLSESAVLGFEFGYSAAAADTLVLWEAQYGDFVNVAQPIIDQFIANSKVKWRQDCSLVMLLPHGYEGGGPEHSSARLERFLQLCAQNNMCVAYPSTPAQYFHILRRQAQHNDRKPLVLMQPKSLLRLPAAASTLGDLTSATFSPVIDDPFASGDREKVRRLVFCTGKIYYDLLEKRQPHVALVRVEELYPWPHKQVAAIVDLYPEIEEVVWVQEEPKNMGAWSYVSPQLRVSTGNALIVRYVGRGERASPAEGYAETHKVEQERIVSEIAAPMQTPSGSRKRSAAAR